MGKVYCAVISRNMAFWNMFLSLQNAANYLGQTMGYTIRLAPHIGDSLVSRARNNTLGDFLESDCDWFFSLDDDITVPADVFTKLIEADKDIIGGIYRLKKPVEPDESANPFAVRWKKDGEDMHGPVEVVYLSTGCIMHKRSFIEQMVKDYPELYYQENVTGKDRWALYQPYVHNGEYLSEDWAFCQRAIDKGHTIWCHTDVRCDHFGLFDYSFANYYEERDKFRKIKELTGEPWKSSKDS